MRAVTGVYSFKLTLFSIQLTAENYHHKWWLVVLYKHMREHRRRGRIIASIAIIALLAVYVSYALLRLLPAPTLSLKTPTLQSAQAVNLPWPAYGQSAVGAVGYGVLASNGAQKTFPIASVAKVLTALSVLQQKPLKLSEQGPTITLTGQDVQFYQNYVSIDGSVVPVTAGEQITEYQALQAMLLPSANNMAQSLATWAFGSETAYTSYANGYAAKLGMTTTHIADASGFSPSTTSSATDLVQLGLATLANPVLSDIVSQSSALMPGGGTVHNVNVLLGTDNIVGIKTGNTDQAGGCFLSASNATVGGQVVQVVSVIEGAPDLGTALRDSLPLIAAAPNGFAQTNIATVGQQFGTISSIWRATTPVVAQKGISFVQWRGHALAPKISASATPSKIQAGQQLGTLSLSADGKNYQTSLLAKSALAQPSFSWRLTHPR
jgi:D-alanyl-D-alanine carboxypeptidase (penicillin-binding protein 5/6)